MLPKRRRNRSLRAHGNSPAEQLESRLLLAADIEWTLHKSADGATPSGEEQELLWLINNARANPAEEGEFLATSNNPAVSGDRDAFNVDVNVLQSDFDGYAAKQPLAYDIRLSDAADVHAQDLIDRDAEDDTDQTQRVTDAGFVFDDVDGNVYSTADNVLNAHARFAIDWEAGAPDGVADGTPARALTMSLDTEWTNIGLAVAAEDDPGTTNGPFVVVENFAIASEAEDDHFNQFIVGTIWTDLNSDGVYNDGEGLSGVTVTPDIGDYFAVTGDAGGYSIPITEPGDYEVTIQGDGIDVTRNVTINGDSILLDIETNSLVPRADLTVGPTFEPNPTSATAGGQMTFEWQVTNQGTSDAGPFDVSFHLSADDEFDPNDLDIGTFTVFGLDAGENNGLQSRTINLPFAGDAFWNGDGEYRIIMDIDRNGDVDESVETNNTITSDVTVNITGTGSSGTGVDLTADNPGGVQLVSATAEAGGDVDFRWEIENRGTDPSGEFRADFYISVDNRFDPNDAFIGSRNVNSLLGGGTTGFVNEAMTLPDVGDPFWSSDGPHFIIMEIDAGFAVDEGSQNELNNIIPSSSSVNVTGTGLASADLSGLSLTISPTDVDAGDTVTATYEIQNTGSMATSDFRVAFYLSQDTNNDPSDTTLATIPASGIAGNSTSGVLSVGLQLPAGATSAWSGDGEYHIIMEVDLLGEVQESEENNNFFASTNRINVSNTDEASDDFELDIDLDDSEQALTDGILILRALAGFSGDSLINNAINENGGRTNATEIRDYIVDAGNTLDIDGDGAPSALTDGILTLRFLAGFSGNSLISGAVAGGATRTTAAEIEAYLESLLGPASGAGGGSAANIDPSSQPDLIAGIPVADPLTARAGESVTVNWSATNQGEAASLGFNVGFYLSGDTTSDPADRLVSTQFINGLAENGGTTGTLQLPITLPGIDDPFWNAADDVYVIVLVDDGDLVDEADETNNVSISENPIQVQTRPDLVPATFAANVTAAVAGDDVTVDWEVANNGNADASEFRVNFFISTDDEFSPGDEFLSHEDVQQLAGNDSTGVQSKTITLPEPGHSFWPADGEGADYFLLMIVDTQNSVDESSETNNTGASDGITITGTSEALPDLTGGMLEVISTDAMPGEFVRVNRQVANRGTVDSPSYTITYFISRDGEVGPGDEAIGQETMPGIAAGDVSATDQLQLTLPQAGDGFWTGDGDYNLIMVLDSNGSITETIEDNNSVLGSDTIAITGANAGNLDIDDDSTAQALTDGILALRFFAGFTGASLTNGAVNPQGGRTGSAEVQEFLEGMGNDLDADGDGTTAPLTDGILILRYLAGFSGQSLINNAIGSSATRTTADAIIDYLGNLRPPANGAGGGSASMSSALDELDDLFGDDSGFTL